MKVAKFLFLALISFQLVQAQAPPPELDDWAELVFNVTLNGYEGLCNACVFGTDSSASMINSPYCTYEWKGQYYNIAEEYGRGLCFYDDPRSYEVFCYSKIANNTLDCENKCVSNAIGKNAIIQEGATYELAADSRCMYKVDWWDKRRTDEEQLIIAEAYLEEFSSELNEAQGGIRRRLQGADDFYMDAEIAV